jgi:sulfane dehydrogenase subunit SoxC
MTSRNDNMLAPSDRGIASRRRFLTASVGVAGTVVAGRAMADTLAGVPPREPGAPMSGHGERSEYVHLSRLPETGPGSAQC